MTDVHEDLNDRTPTFPVLVADIATRNLGKSAVTSICVWALPECKPISYFELVFLQFKKIESTEVSQIQFNHRQWKSACQYASYQSRADRACIRPLTSSANNKLWRSQWRQPVWYRRLRVAAKWIAFIVECPDKTSAVRCCDSHENDL